MSAQPIQVDAPRAERRPPVSVMPAVGRREVMEFVHFPWSIYSGDPAWVPPLLAERRQFVDPARHPFYKHGTAALFLARRGGEVVGRICASDDPRFNAYHGTNQGCVGQFECLPDRAAAHALFDAAADWLRARGRDRVAGPIDYSTNYSCGLLVDGFQTPPRVMMNHHPPYYHDLFESWGFRKSKDLYSWWFLDPHDMVAKWYEKALHIARRGGVTVRPFRLDDFIGDVQRCRRVYNEAWSHNWGFVEMSDAESLHMARTLRRLADPELLLIAEAGDRPVGFCLTLPDFNEAIRPLNGRLTRFGFPIGWIRFTRNLKRIKTARMLTFGVVEGYRRRGISELLILRTLDYGKNVFHYTGAELGWTLEDNTLINRTIEAVGAERYKTYRIYERELGGS